MRIFTMHFQVFPVSFNQNFDRILQIIISEPYNFVGLAPI